MLKELMVYQMFKKANGLKSIKGGALKILS